MHTATKHLHIDIRILKSKTAKSALNPLLFLQNFDVKTMSFIDFHDFDLKTDTG